MRTEGKGSSGDPLTIWRSTAKNFINQSQAKNFFLDTGKIAMKYV